MRESLLDKNVMASTETENELAILPDVNVIAVGGQSLLDRGKAALFPLVDEIVRCRKKHKLIVGVGGGARVRHTFHICLDLGIPLGGLAMVAGAVECIRWFDETHRPIGNRTLAGEVPKPVPRPAVHENDHRRRAAIVGLAADKPAGEPDAIG